MLVNVCEGLKLIGRVTVEVRHDDGRKEIIEQDNLITTAGKDAFAAIISGGVVLPAYIAIGTGTTAPAITNTTMETEVDRNALAARTSLASVSTYRAFFGKGEANGVTISEVGLFSAASGGTLFSRSLLSDPVAKSPTISLTITWTITVP